MLLLESNDTDNKTITNNFNKNYLDFSNRSIASLRTTPSSTVNNNNGFLYRNSTIDEKKLVNSINILKNIIERISKGQSGDSQTNGRNNYDSSSDSFQKLFALAKESVTLSFKDYMLIQKTTTAKSFLASYSSTPFQNNFLNSNNNNNNGVIVKTPSFINAKSFINDYMQHYFNSTRSTSINSKLNFFFNFNLSNLTTIKSDNSINNYNYGDLLKFLLDNTTKKLQNYNNYFYNYTNNNFSLSNSNNSLLLMSKLNSYNNTSLFDLLNGGGYQPRSSTFLHDSSFSTQASFIPNDKENFYHSSSHDAHHQSQASSLLIGIAFFYSFLILTSLISNPLLIYVLLWKRKAQIKLIDIFVANLSLSDLFLTIFNIPLCLIIYFSEQWPFGSLLCQLGTYSTSCSIYVNIFTMAFISIDRYFAVTRPMISNPNCQLRKKSTSLDNTTRRKIYMVLTIIWIIALILSLPQFLFSKVSSRFISSEKELAIKNKLFTNKVTNAFLRTNFMSTNSATTTPTTSFSTRPNAIDHNNLLDLLNNQFNHQYYDLNENNLDELENLENLELLDRVDFGDDPFKKCILDYPYKDMKNYMILINFSSQYLIPSIVILYFYGKIIYHLYLNLNVEDLMEQPLHSHNHNNNNKEMRKAKSSFEIDKVNATAATSFLTHKIRLQKSGITASSSAMNTISDVRQGGLNRTRNLKKSIKVMVIIIALFLLSWLPIHLYRLITTFYPIIAKLVSDFIYSSSLYLNTHNYSNHNSTKPMNATMVNELCKRNLTSNELKECLNIALNQLNDDNKNTSLNYKLNTLHNRYVFFFCYCMAMSSVCYNPIVYFWMHKKFRAEVKQLFSRIFKLCKSKDRRPNAIDNTDIDTQRACAGYGYTTSRYPSMLPTQTNNNYNASIANNKKFSNCLVKKNSNYNKKNDSTKFNMINKNNIAKPSSSICQVEPLISESKKGSILEKNKNKRTNIKNDGGILNSFKVRSKRFSSLSSESTVSSSKKSVQF